MTVRIGGGAKPVKAPPRVRSSPKPRYVPIPAPKPAPITHTGANPRGVAIVTKPAPSKTLTTGANPRGVQIKAPKYYVVKPPKVKAPKPKSSGGGGFLGLGAITPSSIVHVVTHIPSDIAHGAEDVAKVPVVHNALTDVRDFVPTTIEGINTIAQAGAHDLLGVATGATHVGPGAVTQPAVQHSEVKALVESAWKNSITHDILSGNLKAAAQKLINHPLYGALEFAGGVGAVGRVLGAAGRTGLLGARVAEVAKLARDDRKLTPGTPGLPQHGSKNLILRVGQHAKDKIELPDAIERRVVAHHVRKNVNDVFGISKGTEGAHAQEIIEEQHSAAQGEHGKNFKVAKHVPIVKQYVLHHIPADRKVAADVAGDQIDGAVSRKTQIADMQKLDDSIVAHLNDPAVKLTKKARETAESNHANLQKFLKDPNTQAVNEISDSFLARGARLQDEQVHLGLLSEAQAETAPLHGAVAMGHVPGDDVHIEDASSRRVTLESGKVVTRKGGLPTPRKVAYLNAKADLKSETAYLEKAKAEAKKLPPDERKEYLAVPKANVKAAKYDLKQLEKYKNDKVTGIVERTGERLPGRKPKYAYRRIPAAEVRRRLISVGRNPDEMGYVNMAAPVDKETLKSQTTARNLSRSDTAYHSRTAKGVPTGQLRPGAARLLDSQLQTQRAIDRARGFDLLDRTQSVRDEHGDLINSDKHGIQAIKDELEPTHGPLTIIPRHSANGVKNRLDEFVNSGGDYHPGAAEGVTKKERFGLMPTVAANHYLKHLEADKVGNGAWGAVNRAFRNTVLPLSPKWIAGNDIEGLIRSGLVGATPRDARIVGKVVKVMRDRGDDEAADRVESIMNGQHYSMANRRNHEALVSGSLEHPDKQALLRNRKGIKLMADLYMHGIVEPVFDFNRKIEGGFDKAVLGQHMHNQMLQFGASIKGAAMHEQQWIEKLADGYSDPRLVMDAGRFIQKTLGQYSRFGPLAKRLINTWFPFAPWYANALRFVYLTMPVDHPIVQSILLAAGQTVQKEYAAQFASQGNLNDKVGGHRFGALGTSLALQGGGLTDLSRYMPWGAFSGGPINAITSPAGPQIQGPALALFAGEDPFGSPLKDKNGDITDKLQEALIGLNEFALSLAGPLDDGYRILANHGDTAYSGTTIFNPELKPNSHHGPPGILGGLVRTLTPGYPTYLNPADSGGSSGGVFGSGTSENKVFSGASEDKVFSGTTSNNPVFK